MSIQGSHFLLYLVGGREGGREGERERKRERFFFFPLKLPFLVIQCLLCEALGWLCTYISAFICALIILTFFFFFFFFFFMNHFYL